MTKVIKRINPLQVARVTAITYGFFSLIVLLFGIIGLFFPAPNKPPSYFFILIALMYPIFGFVAGYVMSVLYNVVASWVGGIEIEVEDKG
jgi:hypothetical protein